MGAIHTGGHAYSWVTQDKASIKVSEIGAGSHNEEDGDLTAMEIGKDTGCRSVQKWVLFSSTGHETDSYTLLCACHIKRADIC